MFSYTVTVTTSNSGREVTIHATPGGATEEDGVAAAHEEEGDSLVSPLHSFVVFISFASCNIHPLFSWRGLFSGGVEDRLLPFVFFGWAAGRKKC